MENENENIFSLAGFATNVNIYIWDEIYTDLLILPKSIESLANGGFATVPDAMLEKLDDETDIDQFLDIYGDRPTEKLSQVFMTRKEIEKYLKKLLTSK